MIRGRALPGRTAASFVTSEVQAAIRRALSSARSRDRAVVSLKADRPSGETALLCYRLEPFLTRPDQPLRHHGQYWVTAEMARSFLALGYDVDAIYQSNPFFWPRKSYSVVVDVRRVLQRIAPVLDSRCVRIAHLDTAHMLFQDAAEAKRLLALQRRRGITLPPSRFETPNLGLEHADAATTFCNRSAIETFRYAGKPIYPLPIPSSVQCPWPADRDLNVARRRFLFLSSHGLVHKGLDLVLEAFARMPDLHLTVCGPVDSEPEFVEAYRRELYGTPNIETIGWLDLQSPQFCVLAGRCAATIFPSCSEAGPATLIEGMHAGLLPVVTRESVTSGVQEFGIVLRGDTVESVMQAVQTVASLTTSDLEWRTRGVWEYARAHHTRKRFGEEYRRAIPALISSVRESAGG